MTLWWQHPWDELYLCLKQRRIKNVWSMCWQKKMTESRKWVMREHSNKQSELGGHRRPAVEEAVEGSFDRSARTKLQHSLQLKTREGIGHSSTLPAYITWTCKFFKGQCLVCIKALPCLRGRQFLTAFPTELALPGLMAFISQPLSPPLRLCWTCNHPPLNQLFNHTADILFQR